METQTSEQQLDQLLKEGKINEEEYKQLHSAMNNSSDEVIEKQVSSEPEFKAFRKRVLTGSMILAILGLPIGFAYNLPHVWIMGIICIIVAAIKLRRIKDSWLSKLLDKQK
ncbi:MAG: hypothetical protein JXA96_15240 [Sedimentisphaerales bacterium]|nr:hypothetical protein [Sedimentisphaerales bacterium]